MLVCSSCSASFGQGLEIAFAALDLLVEDDAVETLAAFDELLGEVEVRSGDETEAVEVALDLGLRILDALGNLHFLLAGEQRDLAHLLEVHADGIIQDVQAAAALALFFLVVLVLFFLVVVLFVGLVVRFLFLLEVLVTVNVRGFDDVELHGAQARLDGFDQVGVVDAVGQRLVEIIPGEVALFLGQLDEFADFLLRLVGLGLNLWGWGRGPPVRAWRPCPFLGIGGVPRRRVRGLFSGFRLGSGFLFCFDFATARNGFRAGGLLGGGSGKIRFGHRDDGTEANGWTP